MDKSIYWFMGYKAHGEGDSAHSCPFDRTDDRDEWKYLDWIEGWNATRMNHQDSIYGRS